MEDLHRTHKPASADWIADLTAALRAPARRRPQTAPARKRERQWGSRLVAGL